MPRISHKHEFVELGRVFPFDEAAQDPARLCPEGIHDPETGALVKPADMSPELAELFASKVPRVEPAVVLQCTSEDCPSGPRHSIQAALKNDEWKRLVAAHEAGRLDPDGNGTHRLVSQLPLTELGLERIHDMLSDEGKSRSGARESVV